jgi:hypothetical protein
MGLTKATLAWFRRLVHSLSCMWRGGCWLDGYRGLWPTMIACTCGKIFWRESSKGRSE